MVRPLLSSSAGADALDDCVSRKSTGDSVVGPGQSYQVHKQRSFTNLGPSGSLDID